MSATLDANTLCSYFNNCPLMHIEGLAYPVEDLYLEDILRLTQYQLPEKPPPKFQKSYVKHLRKTKEALRENTEKELQYIALIGTNFIYLLVARPHFVSGPSSIL